MTLQKTSGVVFRLIPYGETSAVVSIFTQSFGLRSYLVNGLRTRSGKNKLALYQPLTLLDLVVYHKEGAGLLRIKEARCAHIYQSLSADLKKSCIALFINEVLNRVVKEQSHVCELYDFMRVSLATLDMLQENVENFHLIFLIKLTRFLGVRPRYIEEIAIDRSLTVREVEAIKTLLNADYTTALRLRAAERQQALKTILEFYTVHVHSMHSLKGLPVLREVLR